MIKAKRVRILNAAGKPIRLTAEERYQASLVQADINRKFKNALAYEVSVDTLTTIIKKVTEQKFFRVAPGDFLPIKVGQGSFSQNLLTYKSYNMADDFETGIIDTGSSDTRLAAGDAGVEGVNVKVYNWAKQSFWNIFDLEFAARAGNWDIVEQKIKTRKTNWDLGIQKIAFLGRSNDTNCYGLLTQPDVTVDTTTLVQPISTLGPVDLKAFVTAVLNAYRTNCAYSAWPTNFVLPESDFLGLAGQASAQFPIKSTLELLQDAFRITTENPQFKIQKCAYGDTANNGQSYSQYALYNNDEETLRMDLPVDLTATLANSLDNFNFQNVAYGQFTGVKAYRPKELLYFHVTS